MKKALLCLNNYHRDGEVLLKMQFFSVWTQKIFSFPTVEKNKLRKFHPSIAHPVICQGERSKNVIAATHNMNKRDVTSRFFIKYQLHLIIKSEHFSHCCCAYWNEEQIFQSKNGQ